MLAYLIKKIFGTRSDRVVKALSPIVQRVNELEADFKTLSDADLAAKTNEFRQRLNDGESLESLEPEAFAAVREASIRTLGMRHFDVQIVGGAVLHRGMIAEMKTGEGKTLVATLAAYLNALEGKGVHIVTVNDYLARRDTEWMGQIYKFLGLSVGVVYSGMDEEEKRSAYRCDITYGQNNEFGFDYLRDNMKYTADEMLQRGHHYAIVDEVDSILIDEARTPLIISGPADDSTELYAQINRIIPKFEAQDHYEIDLRSKHPSLTDSGIARAEELLKVENLYDPKNIEVVHHINQALRAHTTMQRDVDYVVKNGEIIIVDEFTGRLMPGRRWSNGLHQAIEAKEGVQIRRENQTLASITFQNLFRMYNKLAGMTGTAETEAAEFQEIYRLPVVAVPTNMPMIRNDESDVVFRTREEKYAAAIDDIEEINTTGQPILVGTITIDQSEDLSRQLKQKGIKHNVLNAKQHEREAEIVAQAGRLAAVTISTNMAGRGTDIMLGGNPDFLAQAESKTKDNTDPAYQEALQRYLAICAEEKKKVIEAGGLFIMGTERHESRRIDNQLRGRSGRQGDPGKSRFYISMEDDLMKRFGGDRMQSLMTKMGWEPGVAMDGRIISRSIETAQQRVERMHFDSRKHVTEYDDVMNKQRQVVYNLRSKVLFNQDVRDEIYGMVDDLIEDAVLAVCDSRVRPLDWNTTSLTERFQFLFNRPFEFPAETNMEQQAIFDLLRQYAHTLYDTRAHDLTEKLSALSELTLRDGTPIRFRFSRDEDNPMDFSAIERDTVLETLDYFWNAHLQEMDHLREGIGLRGYGQLNPLHEYQREGFVMFQALLNNLRETVVRKLSYYEIPEPHELIAHVEAEQRRRDELERRMRLHHTSQLEDGTGEIQAPPKDPDAERARREVQKRARRRKKR